VCIEFVVMNPFSQSTRLGSLSRDWSESAPVI
jgi:hypothetical protein